MMRVNICVVKKVGYDLEERTINVKLVLGAQNSLSNSICIVMDEFQLDSQNDFRNLILPLCVWTNEGVIFSSSTSCLWSLFAI